ncbi:MAG: Sensor protein [Myxococcales bacterium]|nr:Sensor protein [Myxococcales bacterium]
MIDQVASSASITDRERAVGSQADEKLRAQRLFAEAQALLHIGVWEHDLRTNAIYWSDELFQIIGLAPNEVTASYEQFLARVHPDDVTNVKAYITRGRRDHSPSAIEYRIVRPSGETRTLQGRMRAELDEHNTPIRLIGADQDITETKELAARLVFSDRMVSVGTLAGGVAHEINNPLATIGAQLQILDETHPDAGTRDARAAVERIRKIVRGLAAFSRADDEVRASLEVHRVLELAINLTGNEVRHRAGFVKQFGAIPPVIANEARLGHVFINLLVNAAEAVPEGNADRHEIRVTTRTDAAGWALVEVHDNGIGIPRDLLGRVFDPFFTTKPVGQGTGLGLSICHGIVRSLGGDITVRSEIGAGSTFTIALPPATEAPRKRKTSESPRIEAPTRGHVLVIDDDVMYASSLRRLLSTEHAVTVVHNGREALARIRSGERFDAILCDLMMPELTGAELHAELAVSNRELADRIIFITGGAFSPASQKFLERVTNLCFEKPCDISELRDAVRRRVAAAIG